MSSKNKRFKAEAKAAAILTPVYRAEYDDGLRAQWPDGRIGEWLARQVLLHLKRGKFEYIDNWRWVFYDCLLGTMGNMTEEQMKVYCRVANFVGHDDGE